jgi:fatty acid desaturase
MPPPQPALNERDLHPAKRHEYYVPAPRCMLQALRDPRDAPILALFCNVACFLVLALAVMSYTRSHTCGLVLFAGNLALFYERFILALHYSTHRKLTNRAALNAVPLWVLAPFYGIPPGTYHTHHIAMHHGENNVCPYDLSSTEPYQRDCIWDFLLYWLRFLLGVWVELPLFAWRNGRRRLVLKIACTVAASAVLFAAIFAHNPALATWLLGAPLVVGSFLLMFGNWSQHIFIDPADPDNNYKLTYCAINTPLNTRAFNDGYHITHHVMPALHWSELPHAFQKNLHEYKKHRAIVFDGLAFIEVGALVMTGQLPRLARHLVSWTEAADGEAASEKVAFLRQRLRPVRR